jgi:hypothetical protein
MAKTAVQNTDRASRYYHADDDSIHDAGPASRHNHADDDSIHDAGPASRHNRAGLHEHGGADHGIATSQLHLCVPQLRTPLVALRDLQATYRSHCSAGEPARAAALLLLHVAECGLDRCP